MEQEIQNQFGRLAEVTRNLFLDKILAYFQTSGVLLKYREIPIIEKYEITTRKDDQFSTAANIVMQLPDVFERLPLVAVTTVNGRRRPMNVGFPLARAKNHQTLLVSANLAPYTTLVVGDNIRFSLNGKTVDVTFMENCFPSFASVSIASLADYFTQVAGSIRVKDSTGHMALVDFYGRDLTVIDGTAVTKLGFTPGQGPDTSKFYEVMELTEDLEVLVDVMASDRNQRVEIMDIIRSLFGMYVYENDLGQWFTPMCQVIFNGEYSERGESETPQEGAPYSKIYGDSISLPVTTMMYLERIKTDQGILVIKDPPVF
jgi:hypothetical protein